MTPRVSPGTTGLAGVLLLCTAAAASPASAAPPVLRSADVQIAMTAPTTCEVVLSVAIDNVPEVVEHRLELLDGATATLVDSASAVTAPPRAVGRTQALIVRSPPPSYALRYRVQQPPAGAFRCPLWLPTTPADGRSRAVRLTARVPDGARPAGTMPAFVWNSGVGTATLGHLPAFVRLPFEADGIRTPWNLARLMDGVSIAVLAGASLVWLQRTRRRSAAELQR
jgi:hypothetical protein